jgi:hypothetical protein
MAKRLFVLMLALAATPAWALDGDGNYFVRGAGNELCAAYLDARSTHRDNEFQAWLAGYITSFNRWTADVWRIEDGDFPASLNWVDYYCRVHPSQTFDVAAENLIAFLYPNRLRSARAAAAPPFAGSSTPPR